MPVVCGVKGEGLNSFHSFGRRLATCVDVSMTFNKGE